MLSRIFMLSAALVLTLPCLAISGEGRLPSEHQAQFVVEHLDVTSFPNSIGPRREPNKRTLLDYGYSTVTYHGDENAALQSPDRDWAMGVTVLAQDETGAVICWTDKAENGGSYNVQHPLKLRLSESGFLIATDEDVSDPRCPSFAR